MKPNLTTFDKLMEALKDYTPPNNTGGEKDFLSFHLGEVRGGTIQGAALVNPTARQSTSRG